MAHIHMAYVDNTQLKKEVEEAIRGNSVTNLAPTSVPNDIQLVCNVNPKDYRRANICAGTEATNSTTATIYTTPTDKDFYLTSCCLSVTKDVTSTTVLSAINATILGNARRMLTITGITLTARAGEVAISFSTPIKVDRGTNITVTNNTNVANIIASGQIQGYLVDP